MQRVICFLFIIFSAAYHLSAENLPISDVFAQRHSGKSYDPDREVSLEHMHLLMEAARWAPSSHNDQPWYFIVCDKLLTPEAYEKAFGTLKNTQQAWVKNAPLLFIVITRTKELHKAKPNYWGEYDTGAAAISVALQAVDLGLMVHQIGGFDKEKLKEEFLLPEDHKPMTIMVIGYEQPASPPLSRERRPICETFFLGSWGSGFPVVD